MGPKGPKGSARAHRRLDRCCSLHQAMPAYPAWVTTSAPRQPGQSGPASPGADGSDPSAQPPVVNSIFAARYRTLTLGIVAVTTIAAFEAMGVITAMPAAATDLDGLSWYAWGSTAFAVASLFAMATAGGWADRAGPVPPLVTGMGAFSLGLVLAGLAPEMWILLCGRALQGLGFGGVIVAIYVVIGRAYPEHLRPRVFTALSGAWVIPGITGPLVAGIITETIGWRWVFFGVLLLLAPIAAVLIPRLQSMHVAPDPNAVGLKRRKTLALLAAVGTGLLQLAGQRLDLLTPLLAFVALVALGLQHPQVAACWRIASEARASYGRYVARLLRGCLLCDRMVYSFATR